MLSWTSNVWSVCLRGIGISSLCSGLGSAVCLVCAHQLLFAHSTFGQGIERLQFRETAHGFALPCGSFCFSASQVSSFSSANHSFTWGGPEGFPALLWAENVAFERDVLLDFLAAVRTVSSMTVVHDLSQTSARCLRFLSKPHNSKFKLHSSQTALHHSWSAKPEH
jgi:hypothetical protein